MKYSVPDLTSGDPGTLCQLDVQVNFIFVTNEPLHEHYRPCGCLCVSAQSDQSSLGKVESLATHKLHSEDSDWTAQAQILLMTPIITELETAYFL